MSMNELAAGAVKKKVALLDQSPARFGMRAALAGVYLTLATAFAGVTAQAVEAQAEGLGSVVFACLFGLGLFAIIILNAELATGDMMYMVYGATQKKVGWGKAAGLVVFATLANLVGVVVIAAMIGFSTKFADMGPDHLIATLIDGKLAKSPSRLLVEAIGANFVVNMGVVGALFAKEIVSKFFVLVPIIAIFVGLGLEHVIANFSLVSLTFFGASSLPERMTAGAVALNWLIVWVGNVLGGGFLIGGVYAWLNLGPEEYRD